MIQTIQHLYINTHVMYIGVSLLSSFLCVRATAAHIARQLSVYMSLSIHFGTEVFLKNELPTTDRVV